MIGTEEEAADGCNQQLIDTPNSTAQQNTSKIRNKKPQRRYTEQLLQELLPKIKNGSLTMYHVTKYYGIPRSTLQFRLGNKCKQYGKSGRRPVLLRDEEQKISTWLSEMERKGFPITRQRLQLKIASYLKKNPRPNPFKGNVPGRRWIDAFLRRHPQFSMRTPEAVTVASARVSEDDIRRWFDTIYTYLDTHDLVDILKDPSRVLNGDESGFSFQPNSKRVIATKGKKNVPIVEPGNAKQNVTVMYTFAADGTVIPPHVILPYKRLSKDLIQSFPGDWGIGTSASGWMDTMNFVEYIKKVLYPTLLRNKTTFPVLFFVDGHKSHMAFEAAEICEKLGIILVALCPNTTRILQPADVAVFRPLKNSWAEVIDEWKSEDPNNTVTMLNFATLLSKANARALKQSTIVNGFRACGLFPFDQNAVDYSKCLARKHTPVEAVGSQTQAPSVVSIPVSVLEEAKRLIGEEKIQFLYSIPFEYMSLADKALFFILKNILSQGESTQVVENRLEPGMPSPADIHASVISNTQEQSRLFQNDASEDVLGLDTCDDSLKVTSFETEELMDIATDDAEYLEENVLYTDSPDMPIPNPSSIACEPLRDVTNSTHPSLEFKSNPSDRASPPSTSKITYQGDTPLTDNLANKRKLSISDFLTTPPTPKRIAKHRNYKSASYSVLTASERLLELQRIEQDKMEAEILKKDKAEARAKIKQEKEEAKKIKAEERLKQTKIRAELKKKSLKDKENRLKGKKK